MLNKNWKRVGDNPYLRVYEHERTGNIKVIYPKAPKWAQKAALIIYNDLQLGGIPTKKGVKDIVCGLWAKIIADSRR